MRDPSGGHPSNLAACFCPPFIIVIVIIVIVIIIIVVVVIITVVIVTVIVIIIFVVVIVIDITPGSSPDGVRLGLRLPLRGRGVGDRTRFGDDVVGRGVSGPGVVSQAIAGARPRRPEGIVGRGSNSTGTSSGPGARQRGRRPPGPIDGHGPSPCPPPPVLIPLRRRRRPAPAAGQRPARARRVGGRAGLARGRATQGGRAPAPARQPPRGAHASSADDPRVAGGGGGRADLARGAATWAGTRRPKGRGASHCQDKARAPQEHRGPGPELDRDVDPAGSSSAGARGSRAGGRRGQAHAGPGPTAIARGVRIQPAEEPGGNVGRTVTVTTALVIVVVVVFVNV